MYFRMQKFKFYLHFFSFANIIFVDLRVVEVGGNYRNREKKSKVIVNQRLPFRTIEKCASKSFR